MEFCIFFMTSNAMECLQKVSGKRTQLKILADLLPFYIILRRAASTLFIAVSAIHVGFNEPIIICDE